MFEQYKFGLINENTENFENDKWGLPRQNFCVLYFMRFLSNKPCNGFVKVRKVNACLCKI